MLRILWRLTFLNLVSLRLNVLFRCLDNKRQRLNARTLSVGTCNLQHLRNDFLNGCFAESRRLPQPSRRAHRRCWKTAETTKWGTVKQNKLTSNVLIWAEVRPEAHIRKERTGRRSRKSWRSFCSGPSSACLIWSLLPARLLFSIKFGRRRGPRKIQLF